MTDRALTASRSELRLTPTRSASSFSGGRRSPGAREPSMIICLIASIARSVTACTIDIGALPSASGAASALVTDPWILVERSSDGGRRLPALGDGTVGILAGGDHGAT